jgi:hypothetical protein
MITNIFPILQLPTPLHTAKLDHATNRPENAAFQDTGIPHCFKNSQIYFWGNRDLVLGICKQRGWGEPTATSYPIARAEDVGDNQVLLVLLYRALNIFLRSMGFVVEYNYAYVKEQPSKESVKLVYPDDSRARNDLLIHEGFNRSFETVQGQLCLVIEPRIVLTQPGDGGRTELRGPGSIGQYSRINFRRRADKERDMIQFWARFLSVGENKITIAIPDSEPLVIAVQSLVLPGR